MLSIALSTLRTTGACLGHFFDCLLLAQKNPCGESSIKYVCMYAKHFSFWWNLVKIKAKSNIKCLHWFKSEPLLHLYFLLTGSFYSWWSTDWSWKNWKVIINKNGPECVTLVQSTEMTFQVKHILLKWPKQLQRGQNHADNLIWEGLVVKLSQHWSPATVFPSQELSLTPGWS